MPEFWSVTQIQVADTSPMSIVERDGDDVIAAKSFHVHLGAKMQLGWRLERRDHGVTRLPSPIHFQPGERCNDTLTVDEVRVLESIEQPIECLARRHAANSFVEPDELGHVDRRRFNLRRRTSAAGCSERDEQGDRCALQGHHECHRSSIRRSEWARAFRVKALQSRLFSPWGLRLAPLPAPMP